MADTYWNSYYRDDSATSAPEVPSQFAAFLLTEIKGQKAHIIDVGCGNGRDALFFARHGYKATGIDASDTAIEGCIQRAGSGLEAEFICAPVDSPEFETHLIEVCRKNADLVPTIYARFFLHAIDEAAEKNFLESSRKVIGREGQVALEFRTNRDESLAKVTPSHYRRFINPVLFMNTAISLGYRVSYFTEGFGFAKYKTDDAHVARFILSAAS